MKIDEVVGAPAAAEEMEYDFDDSDDEMEPPTLAAVPTAMPEEASSTLWAPPWAVKSHAIRAITAVLSSHGMALMDCGSGNA